MKTEKQALAASEKLPALLKDKTFWNGFGVIPDKHLKGSFVAVVYLKQRKIKKDELPPTIDGVKVVPMYLGVVKPQLS